MKLLVEEIIHLLTSLTIGVIVYKVTADFTASLTGALIGGFLIDADHLIDYILAFGWRLEPKKFLKGEAFHKSDKVYLILHGWEYSILTLWIAVLLPLPETAKAFFLAFGSSNLIHLLFDKLFNNMPWCEFLLIYRLKYNFRHHKTR